MKTKICSLIILLLAASSNATVWAQSLVERFDRFDRNRDGQVIREEAAGGLWFDQLLRRFDRNRNGVLERNEITGAGLRRRTGGTGSLKMPKEPAHTKHLNIRYTEIEGVDPNLLSLDLYVPKSGSAVTTRPVMIMIHGGGWRKGDKASPPILGAKLRHFVGKGYIYASINYRLSSETPDHDGIQHPIHAQDCAQAVAWIYDHIAEYGGDPGQLHLMGHSAGGHLAGIVGTNERFLKAEGKDLSILKSNVLLDPAAIDIPGYLENVNERGMSLLYRLAFGRDEANWQDASPQDHVAPGKGIPPTLLFYAGDRMKLDRFGPAFAKSLTAAGSPSQAVDTVTLDHGQINSHIGMIDEPMTQLIMRLHAGADASTFPAKLQLAFSSSATDAPLVEASRTGVFQLLQQIPMRSGPLAVGVLDADIDGWLDLVLPSGWQSGQFSIALNRPDGEQRRAFQVKTLRMSEDPDDNVKRRTTKGLGLHDFDNDGRMDLVFVNGDRRGGGHAAVYRSAESNPNNWVKIQVSWPENKFGLESKVTIFESGTDEIIGYDEVRTDFCYRSKRSSVLHFGLGSVQQVDVTVVTRDGRRQRFEGLLAGQIHSLKINVAAEHSP